MGDVLSRELIDAAGSVVRAIPNVCAAYLLGSAVKGGLRPGSDLDIALLPLPGRSIPFAARMEAAGELEARLHRPVDFGVLSTRSLVYVKETIVSGRCLFTCDPVHSGQFFATALAMYAELQERRKEVLDAYSA
jgi:predicted nucleotidyltransferase